MTTTEIRTDLLRGMIQSCYVIERARATLQARWGGDFDRDAEATGERAEIVGSLLDDLGFRRPEEVCGPHADWFEGLCGTKPDEVPLGAAVLHQFGKWSDVFATPHLEDPDAFRALGKIYTRVELDFRPMTEDEALLEPAELPEGRRFVILTDIHVGSVKRDALAKIAVEDINQLSPEFVVVPGDITEDGEPDQFRDVKAILDGLESPCYVVPGNHDAVQRSTREPAAHLFAEVFGTEPADHVVECGDLQVALVDTTDPTPSPFGDWDVSKGEFGGKIAGGVDSGALRPGQAEALAERLDPARPALLVQHHELHPFPGFPPVKFALREEDAEAELDALSGHRLVGVVAGHTHRSAALDVARGVKQLEVPSLKDWPFAYSVAGVSDDELRVVVRQITNRDAAWDMSRSLIPLMRRFAIGPLSDLSYAFRL